MLNLKFERKRSRPISRVLSWTVIHLGQMSPFASSDLPGNEYGPYPVLADSFPYLVLLQVGFTLPLVLPRARCALTAPFHPYPDVETPGGIFSVALSVNSRPPGVTWHFALWSPDFPPRCFGAAATAWSTPSGRRVCAKPRYESTH